MPITLSPAVSITERDLTLIAPAVATSGGAVAGAFTWGPVLEPILIGSENELVARFGEPKDDAYIDFYTAANFLGYGNNLRVVRVIGDKGFNASSSAEQLIETFDGDGADDVFVLATSLSEEPQDVSVYVDGVLQVLATDYTLGFATGILTVTFDAGSIPAIGTDNVEIYVNHPRVFNEIGFENNTGLLADFIAKYPGTLINGLRIIAADDTSFAALDAIDQGLFPGAPAAGEIHIALIDETGEISGLPNTLLERYDFLEVDPLAQNANGTSNYFARVLNDQSLYVWATGSLDDLVDGEIILAGGSDDNAITDAQKIEGFDKFANADEIDISLIMGSNASEAVAERLIDIATSRLDVVVCLSPEFADVVNNPGNEVADAVAFRNTLPSTSYAFLDNNWKFQYDRYNDVNRWVPLNGDTAGLMARTDDTNDPWFSPAGFNRGQIKNVIRLAYNATKTQRDELYKSQVNPVVSFEGQGTILFGDRTLLARPSAFDRVNVRRLFIVLEKTIATAAKFVLFEFNDEFTRAQFRNLVEPFLRDVQGRRGIANFAVVANEENNTAQVINENRFVGDIFIDPARSINNIQLNFIATPSGVNFEEIETAV